jgi:hypothetical protein
MNKFFNQKDKRKVKRNQDLINYTIKHIKEQIVVEALYRAKPNQVLIHDSQGKYKIVSKAYALYNMQDDEYETETELEDEADIIERKRIQKTYNK